MDYNERVKEIFGLSHVKHGLTSKDFHNTLHPDDQPVVDAALDRSFARETDYDLEFRVIWPDGSIHWVASRGSVLHDEQGVPLRMFGVAVDITQRKQAEEEIKRRDLLLRHAEAIANFGSYEWVPDTNTVTRSQQLCKIFGLRCEDFEPTLEGYLKRVHPEDRENSRRIIEQATRDHTHFKYEERILLPDGTIRQLLDEGKWVQDEHRKTGKLVGICQDITERRKQERTKAELENQLRQIQKMDSIGRFAGGIAHDFNNLLTLIMGYSELARERVRNDEAARASVEEIRKAAERAIALTRQLLAFSRRQVLHPVIIDLNSVIQNFSGLLRPLIRDEVSLDIVSAQDLGSIKVDPTQIEQVLMNLVLNSRDAITGRGEIVIETRNVTLGDEYADVHPDVPAGPYVMLTVADTGAGMDKETKSHVFEPFFTTKPEGKGTGLGLSVVHGIIKQFGGHIRVLSTPGTGTAFKILFPRADSGKAQPPQIARPIAKGSETIAVVEDEFPIRHMVSTELEREGYRVHAVNASDALEMAGHSCKIHLLLTAVVMPEMSGPDLASRLRSARPDMKTLFISGYPRRMLEYQDVLAPEAVLLEMPFTKQELLTCVRMALDSPSRSLEKVA
jgi:PAS domain S-box-containing protein